MKFDIKFLRRNQSFELCPKKDDRLFIVGLDLIIRKENYISNCSQNDFSYYDYDGLENVFVEKEDETNIEIKSIQVIQLI